MFKEKLQASRKMIPDGDLDLLKDKKRTKTCTCVGKNKRLFLFLISLKDKYLFYMEFIKYVAIKCMATRAQRPREKMEIIVSLLC